MSIPKTTRLCNTDPVTRDDANSTIRELNARIDAVYNDIEVISEVTLAPVGSTPNADGASLSGQELTLQPFSSTHPGVVKASGGGTTNFLNANGTFTAPPGLGNIFNVVTYGADITGVADSSTAINAAITAMGAPSIGGRLYFPPGIYKLSAPIDITRRLYMYSDSLGGTAVLKPDVGVTAIVVHYANDATTGVSNPDGGSGSYSIIENIRINGTQAANWTAGTVVALNSFMQPTAGSQYVLQATSVSGDAKTGGTEPTWSTTQAPGPVGTTIVDHHVTWTYRIQTGIWLRGAAHLRFVDIGGISGDGVQVMADTTNTPPTSANGSSFDQLSIGVDSFFINGNALYIHGGDTNACNFQGLVADGYKGWGVWESSFLGNLHEGHQVASATGIGSYLADNSNARNVFVSCYGESGAGKMKLLSPSFFWGGFVSDGVTSDTTATVFNNGVLSTNITMNYPQTTPVAQNLELEIGAKNGGGLFEIYDGLTNSYYLQHDSAASGWWSWNYAFTADAYAFSTSGATQGAGKFWTPNGIYIGKNTGPGVYLANGTAAPVSGTYAVGDIVFNQSPTAGSVIGWRCITAGTPGTFEAIYPSTGGAGISSFAAVGSSPSANGATVSAGVATLQPADGTHPGVVTALAQTLAGIKTFSSPPVMSGASITAASVPNSALANAAVANLSGTNSGDITLASVGSSPAAAGASLSGQALTLQPFDSTHPGVTPLSGGGTANFLRADGTWAAPAGTAGITALTSDVTATGPGSAAATVAAVGGSTAALVHSAELAANAATAAPTAGKIMLRDASANVQANNFIPNWTTNATGGGLTLNLHVGDSQYQFFTGSGVTQVNLPDETTLSQAGFFYVLENNTTIVVTVKDQAGTTILAMPAKTRATFTATSIASASAGWDAAYTYTASATANTASTNVARDASGNFAAGTITAALTGTASGNTTYSANNHGVVLSSGTNAMTVIAPDASTAKVLTSGGSSADPTWSNTPALSGANFASATIPNSALANGAVANLSGTNSGDVTLAAVGSTPSANAASLSGQALTLQPADATHPGVVVASGTAQTLGGAYTLSNTLVAPVGSFNTISTALIVDPTVNLTIEDHVQVSASVTLSGRIVDASANPPVAQNNPGLVAGAGKLLGDTSGQPARAGDVGEVMRITRLESNATALTSPNAANVGTTTSITLTAGDWDVRGMVGYLPAATTSITILVAAISATSATLPSSDTDSVPTSGEVRTKWSTVAEIPGANAVTLTIPPYQVLVPFGTTKQLFLVSAATFSASTLTTYGSMEARRVR